MQTAHGAHWINYILFRTSRITYFVMIKDDLFEEG